MSSQPAPSPNRVIAVSKAVPQPTMIHGREISTSIIRDPSPEPLFFGDEGPEGNRTAVHTEHVLAFSADHYDHWTAALGIDRADWNWCHWGENLTLADADEHRLRIGQRIRIGDTALFEVTSPRIPCFKLSWRLGQPDSILKDIIASGRIGIYLRVVTPGLIGPGDSVTIEDGDPDAISVADLSLLLVSPDSRIEDLRAILSLPALGSQARGMLRARLNHLEDQQRGSIGRWRGWRPFEIVDIVPEAAGIKSFLFKPVDGEAIAASKAGQHLTVEIPDDDRPAIRSWTLSRYDHESPDLYRLTIKAIDGGRGSGWMHGRLAPGDIVRLKAPAGRFVINRGGFRRVILISAGIGVTPMLAMLQAHALRGAEASPLIWIHVARNGEHHALKAEADALLRANARFQRQVFYTAPLPGDDGFDLEGRLTGEMLREMLATPYKLQPFGREIEIPGSESEVYICGPADFEQMVRDALAELKVADGNVHSEQFLPLPGETFTPLVDKATVHFTASGKTVEWHSEDDVTLLDLAEEAGLSPEFSCRQGNCGMCEVRMTDGAVSYVRQMALDAADGRVLICSAVPASAEVAIDL